ncbi:hypothetical protein LWI29_021775 [Acer saccharum]|uniref:Uncharacterized protein n=1 Tax=Acer saccharum TaxID=4024 RepID=A0AA39VGD7_ACESA|nr:hypothetical protein LWI29_021775 [Acer saccharum]
MVSAKRELSKEEVPEPEAKWAKILILKTTVLKVPQFIKRGLLIVDFSEKFIRPLASIGFSKNGKLLGTAKHFDAVLKMSLLLLKGMSLGNQLLGISLKRYVLLGTNVILDRMKVHGLLRKQNYGERFERLIGRVNAMFDTLLARAARTTLNYIIDRTNVFKSALKLKLRLFANFQKISVVVFPKPEELKIRSNKISKEMGKEVMFVELDRGEARRHLDEMKRALGSASSSNLQANYSPYSQSSVESSTKHSLKNQGAISVGGGH